MIQEVAERAQELLAIEKRAQGPIQNYRHSEAVRASISLAYEMVRDEEDPPEMPIGDFVRARDRAIQGLT